MRAAPLIQNYSTSQISWLDQTFTLVYEQTPSFTGKPFSATTGLYYDYSRWYDPSIGRFISEDRSAGHVSDPQSSNPYVYVGNLPTVRTDPTGAAWCPGADTCEGEGYNLLNTEPLTQEELDSIQDPHTRYICANNPPYCRGMGYIQDDQSGGSLPTTGDTSSPGGPGSGSAGSGEPASTTVTVQQGETPSIQVDTNIETIDPQTIRFTQDSVSRRFSDGRYLVDTANDLRTGRLSSEDIPSIRVVDFEGKLYSLDNRRLVAFQMAGVDVPVERVPFAGQYESEFWDKYSPIWDGLRIIIRGIGIWPPI